MFTSMNHIESLSILNHEVSWTPGYPWINAQAILTEKKAREDTEEALLRMMEDTQRQNQP